MKTGVMFVGSQDLHLSASSITQVLFRFINVKVPPPQITLHIQLPSAKDLVVFRKTHEFSKSSLNAILSSSLQCRLVCSSYRVGSVSSYNASKGLADVLNNSFSLPESTDLSVNNCWSCSMRLTYRSLFILYC